jgi:hypothetical protein
VPAPGFTTGPAELAPNPVSLAPHDVLLDVFCVLVEELEDPPDPPEDPEELAELEDPPPADAEGALDEDDFADVPLVLALPAFFFESPLFRQYVGIFVFFRFVFKTFVASRSISRE